MILDEQDAYREYDYLPMKDGTRLAYVIWREKKDGRYPTLVHYSTYVESGAPFKQVKRFLEAGYAYMGVNVRGTGSSEGQCSYYQPIEAQDGYEVIEWAAMQPWSTGNIGMIGSSYGAHTQVKVAALRPPHLRAIVPVAVEGSEYRDEGMAGGLFNAALMAHWALRVQPDRARTGVENRAKHGDTQCVAIHAKQSPNPAYEEVFQHPLYDDWWHERSLDTMAGDVVVPTLFIHGWQDEWIRPNGALRLFKLLGSTHKKLLLQNGPHIPAWYRVNQLEQIRWLDRWIKNERNGVDSELPVTVFWEMVEPEGDGTLAQPGWVTRYPQWPAPDSQWMTFYLTAIGELNAQRPDRSEECGIRSYIYPLGTELVGSQEQFALAPHPLGSLSYRTAPMDSDLAILGAPQLNFFFSCNRCDTDFMFTLKDVDPSGNILFLQRTVLRASLRAVDEALSSADEIIQSFKKMEELEPGRIYEVKLSLTALGHMLRKGHRLELSILSPNPTPNPIWGFQPSSPSGVNQVYHGGLWCSNLRLLIVPSERAHTPAPLPGVLRNQPCRREIGASST